ncbi:MAG: arginyltransferase [Rhodobacteraceae bacterium]|nr:arginyltransferase [Paracoccaceae bacterium]MCY4197787.1 arginyltransferase [Paracoccaceae bacterium]MCY4326082.1 arginyltransferase [Paracoccaceae bacterium]
MLHKHIEFPSFYITKPEPCSYLEGRQERRIYTLSTGGDTETLYNALAKHGFRRSQFSLYKPACDNCQACLSVRIRVKDFVLSSSMKRVFRQNKHLQRELMAPVADMTQYELFQQYVTTRHVDGGMADMSAYDYQEMVEDTSVQTCMIMYFDRSKPEHSTLVAVCITDILNDGLSMLYSFFDPRYHRNSLGTYMVLDHVRIARSSLAQPSPGQSPCNRKKYVYLGYWIPGSQKMDYKSRFRPLEVLRDGDWVELCNSEDYTPDFFPDL